MENDLALLSGVDIPFESAKLIIHQPTLKEIAYIGEKTFFTGCEFLRFSKDNLLEEDKANLEDYSNFDVIMSIVQENNITVQHHKLCTMMLLTLMFPAHQISFHKDYIGLQKDGVESKIDNNNFQEFLSIMNRMFCLSETQSDYNPEGEMARQIADKLKKRKQQKNQEQEEKKISVFSRYASILAVGLSKDLNDLMQYTVYQLFDEFQRYQLKASWDIYIQAKIAGAKDLKEVDDWMKDIHS